jgi:DNA-directed RNA polymerase specialized sigma24 family protein
MKLPDVCNPTPRIQNSDINDILQRYDGFIRMLARKNIPHSITLVDTIDLDIDDLAQTIRLKLWLALQKHEVHNIPAYIKGIVHNEVIDMVRQHKPVEPLITNDEGELYQPQTMIASGQRVQDPSEEIEQEEMLKSYASKLTEHVPKLPPQQQRAMICALKDQVADLLPLVDLFLPYGIDVESLHWPEQKNELQSIRSSLSVVHNKMRAFKNDEDL